MLGVWFVSFVMGALAGFALAPPLFLFQWRWVVVFLLALGIWLLRRYRGQSLILLTALGFFWGWVHNPPFATSGEKATLVAQHPWCTSQPLLVIENQKLKRAFGEGVLGNKGEISHSDLTGLLIPSPPRFVFKPRPEAPWLAKKLHAHLQRVLPRQDGWAEALFLGDATRLSSDSIWYFKSLGLYHLIVVSGMHMTLCAQFVFVLLLLPLQLAYACRFLSPSLWIRLSPFVQLVILASVMLFAMATGMSASTQRSILVFVLFRMSALYSLGWPLARRMMVAAVGQAMMFPIHFISSSNLMSWTAYLLVATAFQQSGISLIDRLRVLFVMQWRIAISGAMVFGQISLIGIFLNLIFVPLFSVAYVFLAIVLFLLFWWPWLLKISTWSLDISIAGFYQAGAWCMKFPFLFFDLENGGVGRWFVCLAAVISNFQGIFSSRRPS